MKNKILKSSCLLLVLLATTSFSSPKSEIADTKFKDLTTTEIKDYYKELKANDKGETLLSSLQTVLGNQQIALKANTSSSWEYYLLVDRDYEKDPLTSEELNTAIWKKDNVICKPLYDDSFTYIKSNSPGYMINREHVVPKSYGFGNDNGTTYLPLAGTDMHNLHMGEIRNNQQGHNNYPYGNVVSISDSKPIVSAISKKVTGYLGKNKDNIPVYEPLAKDKGDIARSVFYMAARYHTYDETKPNSPSIKLSDTPTDIYTNKTTITAIETKDIPAEYGILSDLLTWNKLDPVDDHEIHRNNLVYNLVQNNRNPFIDYPSWAEICFGETSKGIDLSVAPTQVGDSGTTPPPSTGEDDTANKGWFETFFTPKNISYLCIFLLVVVAVIISFVSKAKHKKDPNYKKKNYTSKMLSNEIGETVKERLKLNDDSDDDNNKVVTKSTAKKTSSTKKSTISKKPTTKKTSTTKKSTTKKGDK